MSTAGMRVILRPGWIISVLFAPILLGCGHGSPDPSAAKSSTTVSNVNDPDIFVPATPRSVPPPPTAPPPSKEGAAQNQSAQSDPDIYVPEKPRTPPAQGKKDQTAQNDPDAGKSDKPSSSPVSQPPTPPKKDEPDKFDPDVYVPEKPRSLPKTVQHILVEQKSAADAKVNSNANPLNLEEQVQIYQSNKTDNTTRSVLEKQFIVTSREALQVFSGFSASQPAIESPKSDMLNCIVTQLWDGPFINFLDFQHQALTTLAERPTAVALATLIPNSDMRTDLRRTLSRHWSEGTKAISVIPAGDCPLAEPGFITVLKSLIRENRVGFTPTSTSDMEWNKLLEALVRDYCRRSHLTSLAHSAASYRNSADSLHESHKTKPLVPLLPGCETIAAYRFEWPGGYISKYPNMAGHDVLFDYQRIEKRMKPSKPLNYYRRQVKSCIAHPLPDGLWLDEYLESKEEDSVRSIDVLITCPKADMVKSIADEQELTVEILSIEVQKSHDWD